MTTSLSTSDVPLTGGGEGNGFWKRTMGPRKNSGTRSVNAIGKRNRERGSGKGNRERDCGTVNLFNELKRETE